MGRGHNGNNRVKVDSFDLHSAFSTVNQMNNFVIKHDHFLTLWILLNHDVVIHTIGHSYSTITNTNHMLILFDSQKKACEMKVTMLED